MRRVARHDQRIDTAMTMSVTNVLSRLDSVVDRLEGVYAQLVPYLEQKSAEERVGVEQEREPGGGGD